MNISSLSINRPVLATVISLLILLFGAIGYFFLGIREYPSVDPPIITVTTNYIGANSDVIESQITEPLEESINGIAGIRSITSTSSDGKSSIRVEFELGVDMETAANDVRDRVSRAVRNIPPDTDSPIVTKSDADAGPILIFTLQSDARNLMELSDIANNVFKERLQTVPGVSEIHIGGERRYSIKLLLDPGKLSSFKLTPGDVKAALERENIELPTGRIEGYGTEMTIRTKGRLTTPAEFNDMIIKEINGTIVRMKDIGIARLLPENERTLLRGNGNIPMVGILITPQPGANHITIADECYKRVEQLRSEVPSDITIGINLDTTLNIRKAITEVQETILIAFGLVLLVIFVFLRSWRTTLIPIIAIPISLISGFFIMYLAGFSINILTLLAIVLATGLVVDDAIVVLENIYHKIEGGMDPVEAGHKGSKEIYFAILSTTVTLAAVFLPIIFLQGMTGRLFREFGVVVAGTVLVSALVSLTLTPMMSSHMLRKAEHHNILFSYTENLLNRLTRAYNRSLVFFVKHRWLGLIIIAISIGMILGLGALIPTELAPMEDKSRLQIVSTTPEGTSFELMDDYMRQISAIADTIPEKISIMAVTAPGFGSSSTTNSGNMRITLSQPQFRKRTQQDIADEFSRIVRDYTFARSYVIQEQTIGGVRSYGLPVQYVILAPSFEKLKTNLPRFMERAQLDPMFQTVDLNLKFNKPELSVEIDRDRARALGINVGDIAENLQLYFSGQRYGYFIMNNKQYQVIGQADRLNRDNPMDLSSVYVRNNKGELIQLDNVVRLKEQSNPPQLFRYNRYVSATVYAQPAKGVTLGQGIAEMRKIGKETFDDSFSSTLSGTSKEFEDSSGSLFFAMFLALILIYLILSAQFESFIDPLIIMFTVPLALAGAVLSLWIFGQTLNIFSEIGVIVLIGIVTKNGILIVEFANQRKAAGLSLTDAVIDAATRRLRPILMTSLATALGALPIAMALGAASRSRVPMGITIIGGLIFSLILTLYVIPALYTYLSRTKKIKLHALLLLFFIPALSPAQETLTLENAIRIGLNNNYSILLQKNQAQISRNDNTLGNAGFLPTVDIDATQTINISTTHQEQFSGQTKDVTNAQNSSLNLGIELNWTLFDGLNMFVSKKMLGVLEDLGENGTRIVVEGTVADITMTYYGIIQLNKLVHVAQEAVDLSMQRKQIARAKLSIGAGSQLMLLQSTVDLNADSTRLIQQMVQLANTKADFNRLLVYDVNTEFNLEDTIRINEPVNYDTILKKSLKQNSQLIAARLNQDLARLGVRQAQSDRYPTLNFTAGYKYSTLNSQTGFLQYNQSYGPSFEFNLNYILFNGFNTNRIIKNAKVLMNSGDIEVQDAEQELRTELLKLNNQYVSSLEVVKMQLSNVEAARENVTVAFEKYKLGSLNDVELREIQQKLIDAEYQLISSQFEAKKAEIELLRLSGELLRYALRI